MDGSSLTMTSAHHCCIDDENNILLFDRTIEKHREIKILEIDFVQNQGEIVSSHGFSEEELKKSSKVELWVGLCCPLSKVLWMDLKDGWICDTFDVNVLEKKLGGLISKCKREFANIRECIVLSSQFHSIKNKLLSSEFLCNNFKIVHDLPMVEVYATKCITPAFVFLEYMNYQLSELAWDDIVAVDVSFFTSDVDIVNLIIKHRPLEWILYSFDKSEHQRVRNIIEACPYKTIIPQFNYTL